MNQVGEEIVTVGDVDTRSVRSNPRTVADGRIYDLRAALADREGAQGWARTGERRHAYLGGSQSAIGDQEQGGEMQPTSRSDVDVGVVSTEDDPSRLLQCGVDDALRGGNRTERPCPELRPQSSKRDHGHRAVGADGDLWLTAKIREE